MHLNCIYYLVFVIIHNYESKVASTGLWKDTVQTLTKLHASIDIPMLVLSIIIYKKKKTLCPIMSLF